MKTLKNRNLPCDIIINIMDKCYSAYSSNQKLKQKGIKAGEIKYLSKDEHFIIPFFSHCFKIENNRIRLSIGKNIAKLMNTNKFIYIRLPEKLINKKCKIKLIEIIPKYAGYRYKINIVYDEEKYQENKKINNDINNFISIDIGVKNLMTIYNPSSNQRIIKGSYLTSINYYFNKKIDEAKSKLEKNQKTSKKIRNLLIKRENILNFRIDKIANKFYNLYKNKSKIIFGYNEQWKNEVNLGRKTNRKFYGIPYNKLLMKIENKFKNKEVERINESYTSKCDALNLEEIKRHEKYDGKRMSRGLFESKTKQIINADLNGAINIMRLYCKSKKIIFEKINGINLSNPKKIDL